MGNRSFDLGNYVEVDERITRFYERYPEGRIATLGIPQVVEIGGKSFIVAQAAAYRTADDRQPCVGTAAEPFPGSTSYTKDSEMMNAETSAWGRALVAAGILAKGEGVASRNEVRNRTANGTGAEPPQPTTQANSSAPSSAQTPELDEMVCPNCGGSNALRPLGNPRYCQKKPYGGCGAPATGDAFHLIPRAAWEAAHVR